MNLRKKVSWLAVFAIVIFSPHLFMWINQYNIKEVEVAYSVGLALLLIFISILTFIDIVNYYEWNDE